MSNFLAEEKRIASSAVKALKSGMYSAISRTTEKRSGDALSIANARSVFKDSRLQRVVMKAPHYIFKQHYGFEGTKKNGVMMRLHATGVISLVLQKSNVLEKLATDIAEIRADQVTASINFAAFANAKFKTRE